MTTQEFRTDEDVFALARSVLADAGYATEEAALESQSVLLAENAYSVVALAATATMDELVVAEPLVESLLQARVEDAALGPKLWDAYVVLLTQERPAESGAGLRPLFGINYDTRGFRRMARVGVEPTVRGVRSALTPFVEPVRLEDAGLSVDPLESMAAALVSNGVEEDFASRAVEIYQQGGRLDDAL